MGSLIPMRPTRWSLGDLCRVIVLLLGLSVVLGGCVGLWVCVWERIPLPDPPPHYDPFDVRHTKEYQITIKQSDWNHRDAVLAIWVEKINELLPELNLTEANRSHRIYSQSGHSVQGSSACKADHKMHVRSRNFTVGKYQGTTSLDIKQSGYDWEACPLPFWPAEGVHSVQKCEHDVHPCFSKHSRVTKVFFDSFQGFDTCGDLMELLPDAFYKVGTSGRNHSVKQKTASWVSLTEFE